MMNTPHVFSTTVTIAAPPERVWPVMADVERWSEWTPSVRKITLRDKGPLAVGTRAIVFQPKFPPALWKVTALEPGRSFIWISRAPGLLVTGRHSLEPVPEGSKVTLSITYEGALGPLMARMTGAITKRYIGFEAEGLKKRCETASR